MGSLGLATRVASSVDMLTPPEATWRTNLRKMLPSIVSVLHLPASWLSAGIDYLAPVPMTDEGKTAQVQHALTTSAELGSTPGCMLSSPLFSGLPTAGFVSRARLHLWNIFLYFHGI